jgi:hypothetical protein
VGYGQCVAFQIEQMVDRAKAGLISEADARRNAEITLSSLNQADRQEALAALHRKAQQS